MIRAAIYARYSSDKQREESIEDQLYECNKYADKQGYEVVGNYCDYAMSGRSDDRPQFLRMIEDGREHRFEAIIVWKMDRFARNMEDQYYYEHLLSKAGVILESVKERVSGTGIEATTNKAVTALFAQIRSQQSAEDTMRGMAGKARKCQYIGYSWFGYGHDGDTITVNDVEANAVREIHERYLAGESVRDIGRWLIENGYKTFKTEHGAEQFVNRLLKSDRYCGVYQWGYEKDDRGRKKVDTLGNPIPLVRVEDGIPAIVSWETKRRVWERMQIRKRHVLEETYELTGKLYCACCHQPMHGLMAYGKSSTYRYYACKGKQTTCYGRIGKGALEGAVADSVRAFIGDRDVVERLVDVLCAYKAQHGNEATLRSIQKEMRGITRQINNLVKAVQDGMPWEHARDHLAALEAQKEALEHREHELRDEKTAIDPRDLVKFFSAIEAGYANDGEIMKAFVQKVWFFGERAVATLNLCNQDATLEEIEAQLGYALEKPQVEGVRPKLTWCPIDERRRTPFSQRYQLSDWHGQAFPLECGIGILVHI